MKYNENSEGLILKNVFNHCHYPCSQHCYIKNCDRFNGSCLTGCTDGFYDEWCEKGKH